MNNKKLFAFSLIAITLSVCLFFVRLSMLQKSNEPTGLDGYFYALQAKSFVLNETLENPSHEIGYYLCGIFSKFCGDAILGCKIYSAFSNTLISIGVAGLLFLLTKSSFISVLGFLLSASSICITMISLNYINNQTGIAFFLLFLICFFHFKTSYKSSKKIISLIFAIIFLGLSLISHKTSLIYSFVFCFFVFLEKISKHFVNNFRFSKKSAVILISSILFAIICLIFVGRFFYIQFPRFSSAFEHLSLPSSHKTIENRITKNGAIEMSIIFVLTWLFSIVKMLFSIKRLFKSSLSKSTIIFKLLKIIVHSIIIPVVLFFPFWNFDVSSDMGFRLFLSAIPFGILLILYYLNSFFIPFIDFARKIIPMKAFSLTKEICIFLLLIIFVPRIFATRSFYNPKYDPPYSYYKFIVKNINLPDDSLLIAHLGLNHVYTYYKNLRWSLNYIPDFEVSGGIWRLCYGANEERIKEILNDSNIFETEAFNFDEMIIPIDKKYILIREDVWQLYLKTEESDIAETFDNWFNPHTIRPQFIRKKLSYE